MANEAVLVAGTRCYFKIDGEVGDYLELEGVRSLGEIGSTGSFVETTTIKDRTRTYVGGLKDTAESTMRMAVYSEDTNQAKFLKAAQDGANMSFKVVYPASKNGKQMVALIDIATSGYNIPETSDGNAVQEFGVSYRISGEPSITFAEQGKVYSISGVNVTTAGTVTLSDGDYILEQGKDFTTSGDGVGAQIKVTIATNAVSAAVVEHGGLGYSVSDTLTVTRVGGVNTSTSPVITVSTVS